MTPGLAMSPALRSPTPAGAPIILAPRMPAGLTATSAGLMNGGPPPLMSPSEAGLMYPYEYQYAGLPHLLEYPSAIDQTGAGTSFVR